MCRSLSVKTNRAVPADASIHQVVSAQDMERYASLPGISNLGLVRDAFIHNFFAAIGSMVVAKGQLVLLPGRMAYISDMFTEPTFRRSGLCNLVMNAMEGAAQLHGAAEVCLAPGYEVASFGLFAKYGYESVATRSVLIPRETASAA